MVSDPTHRNLGAASALLQWGVDLADHERIPAFLEASPHAYGLYKKFGFEDVEMLDVPLRGAEQNREWGCVYHE